MALPFVIKFENSSALLDIWTLCVHHFKSTIFKFANQIAKVKIYHLTRLNIEFSNLIAKANIYSKAKIKYMSVYSLPAFHLVFVVLVQFSSPHWIL